MGKKLIIKGADFSANALIKRVSPVYQGSIITNPDNILFGGFRDTSKSIRVKLQILLQPGESIIEMITDINDNIYTNLRFGAIWSTEEDVDISGNDGTIPNIVGTVYPSTTENKQSDGSFIITNNCAVAAYVYITYSDLDGNDLNASNFKCYVTM